MKLAISLLCYATVCLYACTHKPFVAVSVSAPACDTSAISYVRDVQPVLQANCYSCHGTVQTAGGGLDLQTFSSLKNYLEYGFRGDGIYGSKFYHCILHSQLALPMPPAFILDSCSLMKIKRWIDEGAPQN